MPGTSIFDQVNSGTKKGDKRAAPPSAGGLSPLLSLGALKSGAVKGLSTLGSILARPSEATEALGARGGGAAWNALVHGETSGQQQADRDILKQKIGIKAAIDRLPSWGRGTADAVIDTVLDPTTYLGGAGLIEKGVKELSPHLASALARGASRGGLGAAAYDTLTANGEAVRGLYNALPAAKAQRVIEHLEMAKRRALNATRLNPALKPATSGARRAAAEDLSKRVLQTNMGLPAGMRLSQAEKDAVQGAVRRYLVGPRRVPRGELSKALVGGDSAVQRLVQMTNVPYFMLPFRHMANIGSLAAVRDPLGALHALGSKIAQPFSPALKAANDALIEGYKKRGLQAASEYRNLPGGLEGLPELAAKFKPIAPFARAIQKGANKAYDWSQNTLWNWDDLARATLIKRQIARGVAPETAAHQVNRALVDYGMTSPFTQSLYDVAPFATFRSGIPGAVLRSTLQHPERMQVADRLTGGTFSGGTGEQPFERMYLPPADVGRGVLGDPLGYLRATLSWPVQDIISASGDLSAAALHGEPQKARSAREFGRYFTYGKSVLPYRDKKTGKTKWIVPGQLIRVPFSDELLSNLTPFKSKGYLHDLLQSQLGIGLPAQQP